MTAQTEPIQPKPNWREVKLHRVALLLILIVGGLAALAASNVAVLWFTCNEQPATTTSD
jgi:hypothetical protein